MASDWPRLDRFLSRVEASACCPTGWTVHQVSSLFEQLPVGKRFDKKTTIATGLVPVIDQSRSGVIGYHNEAPGIVATPKLPIVTFANHTCEMRLMRSSFSVIQNVFPLRPTDLCDSAEALYYLTKGRVFLEEYKGHFPTFRDCFICLPPLPEQRAIAATLGALDDKIELNRRMNTTLESMARALFRDWFVDFGPTRAKMEGGKPYLSPDLWSLFPDRLDDEGKPEEWEVRPILDVIPLKSGKTWPKDARDEQGDAVAFGANGQIGGSTRWLGDSEVIFLGKIGSCGAINEYAGKYWPTNNTYYLGKNETPYFHFSRQILKAVDWVKYIGGSSNPYMPTKNFEHLTVLHGAPDVMDAYESLIEALRKLTHSLDRESRTLTQTRDLLLPRLMSGELRVAEAERLASKVA